MYTGLTEKQLLFNSIAFLSQTELLTHFESVSVALLLTETYFLRIQTILEIHEILRKYCDIFQIHSFVTVYFILWHILIFVNKLLSNV